MDERENQIKIRDSEIKEIDVNLYDACKSICKIFYNNKCGTGFLIKLYKGEKELLCLMTNEHVIRKEMIESKEIIDIRYNYEKRWLKIKLDENERYILYNKDVDITIIQIKDLIKEKFFLLPNININNLDYLNREIYIGQYPEGKNLSYSEGKIINIIDKELIYDASTKPGSSGSPIFLKNTIEIIGIHKQGNKYRKENYGISIHSIIKLLFNYKNKININNNYYTKKLLNNLKQGKGILYYNNGNIKYDGNFVNGKFEGQGTYIWENGERYEGQWLNNLIHGKGIDYDKNSNVKYEGDFVLGQREGNGKYIYENDEYYVGRFKNGLRHGKGKMYNKNGNIKYDGDFVKDKKEGYGKYNFENGEYYIGQWSNDIQNGKGIIYYKNDSIKYDGYFENGKQKEK